MGKIYRALRIDPDEDNGGLVFNDGERTGIILWRGFKFVDNVKLPKGISNSALLGFWDEQTPSRNEIFKTAKYNDAQMYWMNVGERTRVEFYRVDFSRAVYKIPNILDARAKEENRELTEEDLDRQFEIETGQNRLNEIVDDKIRFYEKENNLNIP